ncbi:MAG: alpha/beta hydrolase [Acidimicrobiales bacterium]
MPDAPILLLHGLATNAQRTWVETGWVDLIGDSGRAVLAPDLLGHGTAPQPTDPAAYDAFEQYVLDLLPPEPVDAVGFSLGARTLLVIAAAHPERFGRLVVAGVGANLFRHDGSSAALADALAGDGPAADGDDDGPHPMVHQFRQLAASCGQSIDALVAVLRRPNPPRLDEETLAAVTHRTLVVLGDRDFAGPAAPLVDALPDATYVELRNVDHFATPKSMKFLDAAFSHLDV